MTRNKTLYGAAWIGTLILANATKILVALWGDKEPTKIRVTPNQSNQDIVDQYYVHYLQR